MCYADTISWLYAQTPSYQKEGSIALRKYDLSNIKDFCSHLKNPQDAFPAIHIAGTNGKGSVAHMTASVLQRAGYRVGLYTSPHVFDFRERIRICGEKISRDFVINFIAQNKSFIVGAGLSFFEVSVAMAFEYFSREEVDIAVVEVGLGGRLDSTNIVHPILSVITNISWDHQEWLGDTLAKIAQEKFGIARSDVPLVVGKMLPEALVEISSGARRLGVRLIDASDLEVEYSTDLEGVYQRDNVQTVQAVLLELERQGWKLERKHKSEGFQSTLSTGIWGRWQVVGKHPLVVYDVAHNQDALRQVFFQFLAGSSHPKSVILGFSSDKETEPILRLLRGACVRVYFTSIGGRRAKSPDVLLEEGRRLGLLCEACACASEAYKKARSTVGTAGAVLISGSFFLAERIFERK